MQIEWFAAGVWSIQLAGPEYGLRPEGEREFRSLKIATGYKTGRYLADLLGEVHVRNRLTAVYVTHNKGIAGPPAKGWV